MSRAAGLRHAAAQCLPQPMRFAVERQASICNCAARELWKSVDREWLSVLGVEGSQVIFGRSRHGFLHRAVRAHATPGAGFFSDIAATRRIDLPPRHAMNIDPRSADIEHQRVSGPLPRANWPTGLVLGEF